MLQLPAARVITGEPGWVRICCYLAFFDPCLCLVLEEKEKAWDRISSGWTFAVFWDRAISIAAN